MGMDKHTAVGDVLPYLTKAALFKPAIVAEALQKYATNKGTQLWFSSHGIMKRVEWDHDKILQFTRSRRQAEGNPKFT